jgi:hypothetical protein
MSTVLLAVVFGHLEVNVDLGLGVPLGQRLVVRGWGQRLGSELEQRLGAELEQ